MERTVWLEKMRRQAEALYDHWAPAYWVKFGLHPDSTHHQFIDRLLARLGAQCDILDAACGAGRYEPLLLEAGHRVFGVDQSAGMLARARDHFPQEGYPQLRYAKIGLQEMDFRAEFDAAICIDALETVCPEDWPGILTRFERALKPGGWLYATVEVAELWGVDVRRAYEQALTLGFPAIYGEVIETVEDIDAEYAQGIALDWHGITGEQFYLYHYYPTLEQVRLWCAQANLAVEEEGMGDGYAHFLARKGV